MPKVEIELSDLQNMKDEIDDLSYRLKEKNAYMGGFEMKYKKMKEELVKCRDQSTKQVHLQRKAIQFSKWLFDQYMRATFIQLGFDQDNATEWREQSAVVWEQMIGRFNHEKWWESEDLNIELVGDFTEKFRNAFLRIGFTSHDGGNVPRLEDKEFHMHDDEKLKTKN